ncbi:hypothetical protein [Vibrio sp. M260112]|uniref:hypothetical protein n=1 Tax=Vibrio sp. M260112 TaxID=3020895 RepID=UPI002F3EBA42
MYQYDLIDGVEINGTLVKTIDIQPLSDSDKDTVSELVNKQYEHIESNPNFNPVSEKHIQSIKGLMLLNEHASASISAFGEQQAMVTYDDICSLKMTVNDWNIVLTASMAVDEFHHGEKVEMFA